MTHYTEEEAVALAREFYHDAFEWDGIGQGMFTKLLNAAIARKLAAKGLEVLKLREALEDVSALINESCGVYGLHLNGDPAPWDDLLQGGRYERLGLLQEALSTPPATEALDEYVAGKVKELKQKCGEFAEESLRNAAKLAAAEERVKELEKPEKTCKWTDTGAIYNTECGHRWMFEAGDIADNGVKFCPFCAGKIDAAIERSK